MILGLFAAVALGHGPGTCPPKPMILRQVWAAQLPENVVECLQTNDTPDHSSRWIEWRQDVWTSGGTAENSELLQVLLTSCDHIAHTLGAAAAITPHSQQDAQRALERAALLLAQTPWSTHRHALAERYTTLTNQAAPNPGHPTTASVAQCADLGRLWHRAMFGGVYATDRDCAVRRIETVDPPAKSIASNLALAMAEQHKNAEDRALVAQRVADLR